jgi:hypothetical protein
VLGEGRAVLRLADFLELADLVAGLQRDAPRIAQASKVNSAACVKKTTPRDRRKQSASKAIDKNYGANGSGQSS